VHPECTGDELRACASLLERAYRAEPAMACVPLMDPHIMQALHQQVEAVARPAVDAAAPSTEAVSSPLQLVGGACMPHGAQFCREVGCRVLTSG